MAQSTTTTITKSVGSPTSSGPSTSDQVSRGMAILMIIVLIFVLAILITNAVYFSKVQSDSSCTTISASNALAMVWFNSILAFFVGIMLLYTIFSLFVHKSVTESAKAYLNAPAQPVVYYSSGVGTVYPSSTSTTGYVTAAGVPCQWDGAVCNPVPTTTVSRVITTTPAPVQTVVAPVQTVPVQAVPAPVQTVVGQPFDVSYVQTQ